MAESTLREYLESQDDLVREAGLALPHSFSHCTYPLGYLRQAVYLCLTCPEPRGICSACSIACHTKHEQVELFPKRNFRCDCSTSAIAHACTLENTTHPPNEDNQYGQNFQGLFCRCSRTYDAQKEKEAMIQCLACEDWFHESCCNLRERPSSREPTPVAEAPPNQEGELSATAEGDDADADSEASFGLPPPLVSASDYESFICGACVRKIPILVKYAGTPGAIMVVRDTTDSPWVRIGDHVQGGREEAVVVDDVGPSNAGHKRRLSPSDATAGTREPKRTKVPSTPDSTESNPCIAPQPNPLASTIYEQDLTSSDGGKLGTGDIFLTDGFRERWCRCDNVRVFSKHVARKRKRMNCYGISVEFLWKIIGIW
ncbi:hypothetical protein CC2G_003213 [Coprinopsis cinerea AmutBmut pab1-1]|nr:hypothetical protein CC2G_003213 [Coprinopsis cinerea AmutBmut pab1-1]